MGQRNGKKSRIDQRALDCPWCHNKKAVRVTHRLLPNGRQVRERKCKHCKYRTTAYVGVFEQRASSMPRQISRADIKQQAHIKDLEQELGVKGVEDPSEAEA